MLDSLRDMIFTTANAPYISVAVLTLVAFFTTVGIISTMRFLSRATGASKQKRRARRVQGRPVQGRPVQRRPARSTASRDGIEPVWPGRDYEPFPIRNDQGPRDW